MERRGFVVVSVAVLLWLLCAWSAGQDHGVSYTGDLSEFPIHTAFFSEFLSQEVRERLSEYLQQETCMVRSSLETKQSSLLSTLDVGMFRSVQKTLYLPQNDLALLCPPLMFSLYGDTS